MNKESKTNVQYIYRTKNVVYNFKKEKIKRPIPFFTFDVFILITDK